MGEKIALVLETNFIISYRPDFIEIHKKLSEIYDVFVSDVTIQERIFQKYLELKGKYDKIEKLKTDYSDLVEIKIYQSFEEKYEYARKKIKKNYQDLFGDKIIKFVANEKTLNLLMDRVFKKIPPFSTAESASDKGFKDTLIWLSVLEYFKERGENNVIFVTDDKGFRNNSDELCKEFVAYTGKIIEIKENKFFETATEENEESKADVSKSLPDVTLLRKRIRDNLSALCYGYYNRDNYGNYSLCDTFESERKITPDDIQTVFSNLQKIIDKNIFESSLPAETALTINGIKNMFSIPIEALQEALFLYVDICKNYKEYLPQFYSTAANIFNENYDESAGFFEDIPF